ncbi:hypothetical protein MKW98_004257 [Papaver atlanticum]|uniref:Uncharacterized protein n=1 Tax=Papaver atlanticum TaxID=357466 RepID=A0AAD4XSJ2_9MAGN|nr:hypothetical protein MKW98_004257 [Papaver atlanticum]
MQHCILQLSHGDIPTGTSSQDEILSRNHLPVVVGGTNFYIRALVSPFLLVDSMEDMDDVYVSSLPG